LDNCEHLLDAAAALAGNLARSCERLVILATSREGLGIDGERLGPVPPLGGPRAGAGLAAVTQGGGGRPFGGRAAGGRPGFPGGGRERGGGRRGGAAAGRDRAGGRAGGGANTGDDPGRAGSAAGAQLRRPRGRPPGRGGTAPDAAGGDRLVVRVARR